jgi:hypothetical protein
MNKCIRYADFERILTELGFAHTLIDGRRLVFENAAYDALLVFPPYRQEEVVQPHDWMKTRHTVDVMGILDRDEFDKRLDRCDLAKATANSV